MEILEFSYKSHSFWLNEAFRDIDAVVNKARKALESVQYDTMVGTGLSGSLVIPVLAREFGKYFAIVRKDEARHSDLEIEGQIGHKWIFVDDFIGSGATRGRVKCAVNGVTGNPDLYVGSYLYHLDQYQTIDTGGY